MIHSQAGVHTDYWGRLLIERMKEIAHLNCVLRKKNRRLKAQKTALREAHTRIRGLLQAFQSVEQSKDFAEAQYIAMTVLKYSDEFKGLTGGMRGRPIDRRP